MISINIWYNIIFITFHARLVKTYIIHNVAWRHFKFIWVMQKLIKKNVYIKIFVLDVSILYSRKRSENLKETMRTNGIIFTLANYCRNNCSRRFQKVLQNSQLTHVMPLVFFFTSWKHQKARGVLRFSGGIERDQWHEMD